MPKLEIDDRIDINKIDVNYGENIANAYEKIERLWDLYKRFELKDNNIINYFWRNIVEFHYCKYGNLNQIEALTSNKKENNDKNINQKNSDLDSTTNEIQKITEHYKQIIKSIKYINFQIYHISNGGNKKFSYI